MGLRQEDRGLEVARGVEQARDHLSKAKRRIDGAAKVGEGADSVVHEVRKRIKKARALIRLARGVVGRKAVAKANRLLRDAARPLSAVRDASVLIETLDALADGRGGDPAQDAAFAEARATLAEHRGQVIREQIARGGALPAVAEALRSARRRLARWRLEDAPGPVGALKRAYRQGREAFALASGEPASEALHELRKRVKALGYQLRVVEADPTGDLASIRCDAGRVADDLGRLHDLDVLRDFLALRPGSTPILMPLDALRSELRASALEQAGRIFAPKPRDFARALEGATAGRVPG